MAFPTQMPLPCSAISKCTHGSPTPSSPALISVLLRAPLLKSQGIKWKEEERMRPRGNFSFKYLPHLCTFPLTRSLWTIRLAQPNYSRLHEVSEVKHFHFRKALRFFVFFRCQQRAALSFPQLHSPDHQICVPQLCFPMDSSGVHKDKAGFPGPHAKAQPWKGLNIF